MKTTKALFLIVFLSLLVAPFVRAQQQPQQTPAPATAADAPLPTLAPGNPLTERREHPLGPGDVVELRVFGEPQLDGSYDIDSDGNLSVPFIEQPIRVQCRTVKEVRKEVVVELSKFLRKPQVYLRVKELHSRPPAVVYGAVRSPAKFDMHRPVRLLELLSNSHGVTEQNNGTIQITHTLSQLCPEAGEVLPQADAGDTATDDLGIPYTIYKVSDLKAGMREANPYIRPGDIVYVAEASPIYVTGSVLSPQGIYLREQLTLTNALAMVGGVRPEAKTSAVKIYRLKSGGGTARETIIADFKAIKTQKISDIVLQPYDVIEVPEAGALEGKNLLRTLTGMVTGGAQSLITNAPLRVIY
ncbi:polysaccharide biosynthesis/export family protein [soil metagenome]